MVRMCLYFGCGLKLIEIVVNACDVTVFGFGTETVCLMVMAVTVFVLCVC